MPQPCPIPRCALEIFLAAQMAILALFVGWAASPSPALASLVMGLPIEHGRLLWGALIGVPALIQLSGLFVDRQPLHRWAAGLAALVMLIFTLVAWRGDFVPVLAGLCAAHAIAEVFVFAMLRGARWTS